MVAAVNLWMQGVLRNGSFFLNEENGSSVFFTSLHVYAVILHST